MLLKNDSITAVLSVTELEDFMSENMTFEPTSDEDNVHESKTNRKIIVKTEEEEVLINKDNKFIVDEQSNGDDSSKVEKVEISNVKEENTKMRQDMERDEMIRLLLVGDAKSTLGYKRTNDDDSQKERMRRNKEMI